MNDLNSWNHKAEFWDEMMGADGNRFHRLLVEPATLELLAIKPEQKVLDLACGTGVLARRLHLMGAKVQAVDASPKMIELAKLRGPSDIDYQICDLTIPGCFSIEKKFDAILCTMALMDISDITPVIKIAAEALKPEIGRFVVALCHPCFNSVGFPLFTEIGEEQGISRKLSGVKVMDYLDERVRTGVGAPGEPCPHSYFHRPLHVLLREFLSVGFYLDGLAEPAFPEGLEEEPGLSWQHMPKIPPVLVLRFRRGGPPAR